MELFSYRFNSFFSFAIIIIIVIIIRSLDFFFFNKISLLLTSLHNGIQI